MKESIVEKKQYNVKYGLPSEVKFCKKCVMSNQRPSSTIEFKSSGNTKKSTIDFNDEGICSACVVNEKKKNETNWAEREQQLVDLCNIHRSKDGSYDCIVPGSGGKDSFYAAHILKYKYKMHPLTVTWAPNIYTPWGWKNFQSWIHAGFDNHLITPNGRTHRLLTRLAVENLLHPFQPFIIGQKSIAAKLAVKYNIALIFYGENEAEYGNASKTSLSAIRDPSFSSADLSNENILLGGVSIQELKKKYKLTNGDLSLYLPMDSEVVLDRDINTHYLGYYLPWHPQGAYYYAVEEGGFEASPERTTGTYSKYNSIDDKIDDFHYYTTYIKFGIGRATYDASQEIRNDEIDREEGVSLVNKYDGEYPERFSEEVFKYLTIDKHSFPAVYNQFKHPKMNAEYFSSLCDEFRSEHLWKREGNIWKLRGQVEC